MIICDHFYVCGCIKPGDVTGLSAVAQYKTMACYLPALIIMAQRIFISFIV